MNATAPGKRTATPAPAQTPKIRNVPEMQCVLTTSRGLWAWACVMALLAGITALCIAATMLAAFVALLTISSDEFHLSMALIPGKAALGALVITAIAYAVYRIGRRRAEKHGTALLHPTEYTDNTRTEQKLLTVAFEIYVAYTRDRSVNDNADHGHAWALLRQADQARQLLTRAAALPKDARRQVKEEITRGITALSRRATDYTQAVNERERIATAPQLAVERAAKQARHAADQACAAELAAAAQKFAAGIDDGRTWDAPTLKNERWYDAGSAVVPSQP